MQVTQDDLRAAADAGIITPEQTDALQRFLEARSTEAGGPRFGLVSVLWYAGALVIIGAMGLFSTIGFASFGSGFLLATALVYAAGFAGVGAALWRRPAPFEILGGLLVAVAVTMAPLATFAVQDLLGWWEDKPPGAYRDFYIWVKQSWVPMDLATIAAGIAALCWVRFPFLVMPVAVALWFLSMDFAHWVTGGAHGEWEYFRQVTLVFGLGVLAVAWVVDVRAKKDFAFWLHLFGLMSFWGGLSSLDSGSEIGRALYAVINAGLVALSVFLNRRAYAVFGALGVSFYLGHLAETVFRDSLLFPFALSLIGVAIIALGIVLVRRAEALQAWMQAHLPAGVLALRPAHARIANGAL
ncbi:hypothetical protein [Azospirillum sp. sgz301742]